MRKGRKLVAQITRRRRLLDQALRQLPAEAQLDLANGMRALAAALGETAGDAWTLGWSLGDRGSVRS